MSLTQLAVLLALLFPSAIDTFLLSGALGLAGLPPRQRLRTSLTLAAFEAAMPLVGVLLGRGAGTLLGEYAAYGAAAVAGFAGILLLRSGGGGEDEREQQRLKLLGRTRGLAAIGLGVSISVDDLAIGTSLGLLHMPVFLAVLLLTVQSFAAGQLGLWLGARLNARLREGAERFAGATLILVAIGLAVLKLTGRQL
jgi:manganese efflux pump family protein